jgi:hypothetical protein
MAMGFLMKDSLYILQLTGERDSLGAEKAVFTRGARVQCGWGRVSTGSGDTPLGRENRGLNLAIVPPLDEEPRWVEHGGKVYGVKETRRFTGFSTDHWELTLEEYLGRFEIT